MGLKANYHTHVKLCGHAEGMSEDYILKAIELNYKVIGMSDHGPISRSFMTPKEYKYHWLERQMSPEDFYNLYLPDLDETIKKYGDKIKIYRGLEIEYLKEYHEYFKDLRDHLDYLSLGLHFYTHNGKLVNSFDDVNTKNVYSYALCAKEAFETGMYKIMTHPDVFLYHYHGDEGFTVWDKECEKTSRLIIEEAIKNNVYLEINCGGIFKVTAEENKEVGSFAYPRDEFWEIAKEYKDLKVIIGVDAHKPSQLAAKEIDMAFEFAKKHGIKVLDFVEELC